ncbi:unnamed protein product, partial [Ectocarpus sp. 4 AP-2014]
GIVTISVECFRLIRRHKSEESALLLGVRKDLIDRKYRYVSYNSLSSSSSSASTLPASHLVLRTAITNQNHGHQRTFHQPHICRHILQSRTMAVITGEDTISVAPITSFYSHEPSS